MEEAWLKYRKNALGVDFDNPLLKQTFVAGYAVATANLAECFIKKAETVEDFADMLNDQAADCANHVAKYTMPPAELN